MPAASRSRPSTRRVRRSEPSEGRVRARTRRLLLDAALRVFAKKGAGAASIHEIAAEAGVANGTFYNYFRTRDELLGAACVRLAERLSEEIAVGSARIADPAERVAIGCRRYLLQALRDPTWGAALLRVSSSTPALSDGIAAAVLADLRPGRRRGRFRYPSEAAALDLAGGAVLAGVRTVVAGRAGAEHASHVASLVLRGLGVAEPEAAEIASRPLPPLGAEPM